MLNVTLSASFQYTPQVTVLYLLHWVRGCSTWHCQHHSNILHNPQCSICGTGSECDQCDTVSIIPIYFTTHSALFEALGKRVLKHCQHHSNILHNPQCSICSIGSEGAQTLSASLQYTPQVTVLYLLHWVRGCSTWHCQHHSNIRHNSQCSICYIGSEGAQRDTVSIIPIYSTSHSALFAALGKRVLNVTLSASLQYTPQPTVLYLWHWVRGSSNTVSITPIYFTTHSALFLTLGQRVLNVTLSASFQYTPQVTVLYLRHWVRGCSTWHCQHHSNILHNPQCSICGIGSERAQTLSASFQYTPQPTGLYLRHWVRGSSNTVSIIPIYFTTHSALFEALGKRVLKHCQHHSNILHNPQCSIWGIG